MTQTFIVLPVFEPSIGYLGCSRKRSGGEGGIRTPDSLATMSDFESGAFNRALPPLRTSILIEMAL